VLQQTSNAENQPDVCLTNISKQSHLSDLPRSREKNGAGNAKSKLGSRRQGDAKPLDFRARYNLDYRVLMRYEHVNTDREIENVLRYFFSDVRRAVFGLSRSLSFASFTLARPRGMNAVGVI
jgi:hypothetical protein